MTVDEPLIRLSIKGRKRWRDALRLQNKTQETIAKQIGITPAALSRYLSGKRVPEGSDLEAFLMEKVEPALDLELGHLSTQVEHLESEEDADRKNVCPTCGHKDE